MKHICQIIIVVSVLLALSVPVMAQHFGPYAGVYAGGDILMTGNASDSKGRFNLEFDPGIFGSTTFGWDFSPSNPVGEGRIELEYNHRSNKLDQAKFADGKFKAGGDVIVDSLLVNFIGVYRDNKAWSPYFGVGLGAALADVSKLTIVGNLLGNGSSTVFAYQALTGIEYALTERLSLDLGYRFFGTLSQNFTEANGQKAKMDYFSHNAVLGLKYGF
jgi:opacity protein-like surface antigen